MEKEFLNLLLADDDEADRILFKEAFEELKTKTKIRMVNNGEQLMDYLNKKEGPVPQLIFLDLNMPRKNGMECLKEIRGNDAFNKIPIAIYSTSASEKDIQETFLNGANVYIKKPSDFNVLKAVLAKVISSASVYQDPPFNIDNFILQA
jgi:CheY-like chemotaxis protein